jgi:predicted transposase YdaD
MQWISPWIELGKERGPKHGLERGLKRGKDSWLREGRWQEAMLLVFRQLRHRFGSFATDVEPALRSLTLRKLESLSEALLDFRCPADLADWLHMALFPKRRQLPRNSRM